MTLMFTVCVPFCMSISESSRMKPLQGSVHNLPSNISTMADSPCGNLVMSNIYLIFISVFPACQTLRGENDNPQVLHNHTLSLFSLAELGCWLHHPGCNDLSRVCKKHQKHPCCYMSGSGPKWHFSLM